MPPNFLSALYLYFLRFMMKTLILCFISILKAYVNLLATMDSGYCLPFNIENVIIINKNSGQLLVSVNFRFFKLTVKLKLLRPVFYKRGIC